MIEELNKLKEQISGMLTASEEQIKQAHTHLDKIEDTRIRQYLADALEAAKAGKLNINDFIEQVKTWNDAS